MSRKELMANELRQELGGGALARRERILGKYLENKGRHRERFRGQKERDKTGRQTEEIDEHQQVEELGDTEEMLRKLEGKK